MNRTRRIILCCALAAAVGGGSWAAWKYWPRKPAAPVQPDPAKAAPVEIAKYMASPQYAALPLDQRVDYFRQIGEKQAQPGAYRGEGLTDQEKEALRKNMEATFRQELKRRMDEYFKLPMDQRAGYLDGTIDEMLAMQKKWRRPSTQPTSGPGGGPGGGGGGSGGWAGTGRGPGGGPFGGGPGGKPGAGGAGGKSLDRFREQFEKTDPAERAQMVQFFIDLRVRMLARGMTVPQ